MTTPIIFKEYIWLVNTIHQTRNITLNDINKKWLKTELSGGIESGECSSVIVCLDRQAIRSLQTQSPNTSD